MMDLGTVATALLLIAIGGVATLYSTVGHGGATGYLAVMGLLSVPSAFSRPGALWLNCCVAVIAFWRFQGRGHFDWKLFGPLASVSIPLAWLGSKIHLHGWAFAAVLALVLTAAGVVMFRKGAPAPGSAIKASGTEASIFRRDPPALALLLVVGSVLGFLAGLTGIGGGVFLTPLLIFSGWASAKTAAGISALFILVNSAAGLAGLGANALVWSPVFAVAVVLGVLGAATGSWLGACRWNTPALTRALSIILWIAAVKLIVNGS